MAGGDCRASHALLRFLIAGAAASVFVCTAASVAGATTFTTPAAESQIHATQSQVTQLLTTIQHEQQESQVLSQEYDAAETRVQTIQAQLVATEARIAQNRKTIAVDKAVLARAAVQAYILGSQGIQIEPMFTTSANTEVASQEYTQTAVGNLAAAKRALDVAQAKLTATEEQQQSEEQQAQSAAAQVKSLEQQNEQAAAQAQATLASVKGTLANEVAAAAQAKAEKEAAAAAAARAAAAREAAAEQAEQDAGVVNELDGTTQAATDAANTAASGAGGASVGFGGSATAAGDAAVQAAESQLGVPYVWGGETPGVGFDCSGLTQWSWGQAGVAIPRTAASQYSSVPHVSLSDLAPGDLLFYYDLDGTGMVDHVAMYVGSGPYGIDTIIQAPYTGATVSFDSLYTEGLIAAGQP